MRIAITACLVPEAAGGPFVWSGTLVQAWAETTGLGFDGIEIFPLSAEALLASDVPSLLESHALRVAAVGTGAGWVVRKLTLTHPDPAVRAEARAFIHALIDAAGAFGAPAIIGSMQGRSDATVPREQALAFLGEALEELGQHAAGHGVPLLYEPLNRYETNLHNRLGDAGAWLSALRIRNVKILADLFHMNIEEASAAAALREAGPLIGHVHFADSNRRAIGFGQTVVPPIVAALREIGYSGYLSGEIFPWPNPEAAARQTIAAYRQHIGTD